MPDTQTTFARLTDNSPATRMTTGTIRIPTATTRISTGTLMTTAVTQLRPVQNRQAAPRPIAFHSLPAEPEDARMTGGTRSLDRRLLALNLSGSRPAVKPTAKIA